MFQPSPHNAAKTTALAAHLRAVRPGQVVTFDEMSKIIKVPDIRANRGPIYAAMRKIQREENIVFVSVPKVGIKRVEADGIADIGDDAMISIRRKSRRASAKMLSAARGEALTPDQARQVSTRVAVLGAIGLCSTSKALDQAVKLHKNTVILAPADSSAVLDLFKSEKVQ